MFQGLKKSLSASSKQSACQSFNQSARQSVSQLSSCQSSSSQIPSRLSPQAERNARLVNKVSKQQLRVLQVSNVRYFSNVWYLSTCSFTRVLSYDLVSYELLSTANSGKLHVNVRLTKTCIIRHPIWLYIFFCLLHARRYDVIITVCLLHARTSRTLSTTRPNLVSSTWLKICTKLASRGRCTHGAAV